MSRKGNSQQEWEVEAIIGYRIVKNKEQYRIKWAGFNLRYATWEPIEHLANCMDKINDYKANRGKEILQIDGCGDQNGTKYFLVQFKGEKEKTFIDWDTAKSYSEDVMEYLGRRMVWMPIPEVIGGNNDIIPSDSDSDEEDASPNQNRIDELDAPNDIEYD